MFAVMSSSVMVGIILFLGEWVVTFSSAQRSL